MLKIQYCTACVDFLTHHDAEYYDVFRSICEFYLIKQFPFEFVSQEEGSLEGFDNIIYFLETHEFVISTECSEDCYLVKPLGLKKVNPITYRICMLGRGHG